MAQYEYDDIVHVDGDTGVRRECRWCGSWVIDTTFIRKSDHTDSCILYSRAIEDMEEKDMSIEYSDYNDRMDKLDSKLDVILDRIMELVLAIEEVQDVSNQAIESIEWLETKIGILEEAYGTGAITVLDDDDY